VPTAAKAPVAPDHLGAPKPLDQMPILGFPTYDSAQVFSLSTTARF